MAPPVTALVASAAVAGLPSRHAHADATPRVMQITFQPAADDLQIAVWLEDMTGTFVKNIFVTRAVGTFAVRSFPSSTSSSRAAALSVTSPAGLLMTRPALASSEARFGRTRNVTSLPA